MKRGFTSFFLAVCCLLSLTASQPVFAITQAALDSVNGSYPNYDPTEGTGTCGGSTGITASAILVGNENAQKIYNFFISKGLTPIQAAGIDGNFGQESQWNPADGGGYLAQWGGGRLANLEKYAASQNKPVTDLGVQVNFVWKELNESYPTVLAHVRAATTIEDATIQFMGPNPDPTPQHPDEVSGGYENPGTPATDKRIGYAKGVLQKYGGDVAATATLATEIVSGDCTSITGSGQNTRFIDGFTIYSQCDPAWGKIPLGDADICANGCGPTAMAMIITNLTKQPVTPNITAKFVTDNNLYKQGSSWNISPKLATAYNLKATALNNDVGKVNAALQSGALVIAAGSGALPFSKGGHFIVIRALTSDGKWKIGNSAFSQTNDQTWDPNQIMSEVHDGSMYAISK